MLNYQTIQSISETATRSVPSKYLLNCLFKRKYYRKINFTNNFVYYITKHLYFSLKVIFEYVRDIDLNMFEWL